MSKKLINVPVGNPVAITPYFPNGLPYRIEGRETVYFESSIDSLIKELTELKAEYGGEYQDLRFTKVNDCGCYHDCSCSPSYVLYGTRIESDLEYDYRVKTETERAEARRLDELKQLAELQKKYGSNE